MLDKYYKIKEDKIICGQTNSGIWYCKELPASTTAELKVLIGEVNKILNQYNKQNKNVNDKKKTKIDSKAARM